ncbi:hypothetical protein BH10ACT1_BH10ACT1_01860 [soil metagenome]
MSVAPNLRRSGADVRASFTYRADVPVRCVAFDADDTLWDFRTTMLQSVQQAIDLVAAERPSVAAVLSVDGLVDRWEELYAVFVAERPPGVRIDALRADSFRRALADLDVVDDGLVERMAAAYFEHRHGQIRLYPEVEAVFADLHGRHVLGLVTNGNTSPDTSPLAGRFDFRLAADEIGIRKPDRRMFTMAAAAAGCHPAELVYVGDQPDFDVAAPQAVGCRGVWLNRTGVACPPGIVPDATISDLTELPAVLDRFEAADAAAADAVGVGPHPEPWPDDDRFDPELLAAGDRRNVVDRYRWWRESAIVADLDQRRHPFHVAVENWRHDRNIGAVVRNANAFGAAGVHIVGRKRWNRRGAMATDRYLHVQHHDTIAELVAWAAVEGLAVVGIDNVAGSVPIEGADLPERCVLVFGQEGPGLSAEALAASTLVCSIAQFGSTRSVNAGVASGIAMHDWVRAHVVHPGS